MEENKLNWIKIDTNELKPMNNYNLFCPENDDYHEFLGSDYDSKGNLKDRGNSDKFDKILKTLIKINNSMNYLLKRIEDLENNK